MGNYHFLGDNVLKTSYIPFLVYEMLLELQEKEIELFSQKENNQWSGFDDFGEKQGKNLKTLG